jgi:hypothetical protein
MRLILVGGFCNPSSVARRLCLSRVLISWSISASSLSRFGGIGIASVAHITRDAILEEKETMIMDMWDRNITFSNFT